MGIKLGVGKLEIEEMKKNYLIGLQSMPSETAPNQ
jgi:hypothetical protein